MHISKIFFRISDVVNHPIRNYKRYGEVERVRDVKYDDGKYGYMNFYFAPDKKEGKYPVLFNVHGGGFVAGGRKYRSGIASVFARNGYFVVNADYTLAPEGKYPVAMRDLMKALNKVYDLRDEYDLDFSRLVITGDSAGGFYAAEMVAMIYDDALREEAGVEKFKGNKPAGLLTFCAPFDPVKCLSSEKFGAVTDDVGECLFGKQLPSGKREFEIGEINVANSVTPEWCKCFMVEAAHDDFCGGQVADMSAALERNGVWHDTYIADKKGDGHCTHLYPFKKGTPYILAAAIGFLDTIKNGGASTEVEGDANK